MEKKKKKPGKETHSGGPSNPLGDIFAQSTGNRANVMVMHGPYAENLPVDGMTIEKVRNQFADRFDIDPNSIAIVDGNEVGDENFMLKTGMVLMFTKKAGEKGTPKKKS